MLTALRKALQPEPAPARLVVCVGVTKGGTSWFYGYLRNHPDAFMRGVKEYNHFGHDRIWYRDQHLDALRETAEGIEARMARGETVPQHDRDYAEALRDWVELCSDDRSPDAEAFMAHLTAGRRAEAVVADVSPGYGLLKADDFAGMLKTAGDVRLVCFLRDPFDRAWSAMRMRAVRRAKSPEDLEKITDRLFRNCFEGGPENPPGKMLDFSFYADMVPEILKGAGEDRAQFFFYERLFDAADGGAELRRLSDFIGIAPRPEELGTVRHKGKSIEIDPARVVTARRSLARHYQYCADTFGDRLPQSWRDAMASAGIAA